MDVAPRRVAAVGFLTPVAGPHTLPAVPPRRADRDHEQLAAWGEIREAATDAFAARHGVEPIYVIAVGRDVHVTTSLKHPAEVTRRERHRWGVLWPEDGRR